MSRSALEKVAAHARAEAPHECCGFLVGVADAIRDAVMARNVATVPATRFRVNPQDHFDTLRTARKRGLEILGFYHSHPYTPPWPSETDRAEASYPGHLYLIVSLAAGTADVHLFRFVEGNFSEVGFVTVD